MNQVKSNDVCVPYVHRSFKTKHYKSLMLMLILPAFYKKKIRYIAVTHSLSRFFVVFRVFCMVQREVNAKKQFIPCIAKILIISSLCVQQQWIRGCSFYMFSVFYLINFWEKVSVRTCVVITKSDIYTKIEKLFFLLHMFNQIFPLRICTTSYTHTT